MSAPRGFSQNGAKYFTNITTPQIVNASFIVDSTNALGIRSLKSNGYIESIFMDTSTTPGVVNGVTNPDPLPGYALVTFKNNFNKFIGSFSGQVITPTSTGTTSVTVKNIYVITSLGTTSLAQWRAKGLPAGFTPAVGVAFVATATGALGGTGTVGIPGVPLATQVSIVGDANTTIRSSAVAQYSGAQVLLQFSRLVPSGTIAAPTLTMDSYTPQGTNDVAAPPIFTGTPAVLTGTISAPVFTNTSVFAVAAPANETVVQLQFQFDASSVTIDGL